MPQKIKFYKYQGTGNDFIMIDNRDNSYSLSTKQIALLCNRHFGIGADGLIFIENSKDAHFYMRYFNADGKESTMCGNGGRCAVKFAQEIGIKAHKIFFFAKDGKHIAYVNKKSVKLKMQDVKIVEQLDNDFFIDTGSPHYVRFVANNIEEYDVVNIGKSIRYSQKFKTIGGTNVNFVTQVSENQCKIRTYERGVENETLSCGTGVVASAIASAHNKPNNVTYQFKFKTKGGNLNVSLYKKDENTYTNIFLKGPANKVFKGIIKI